jgi:hypothetical protein
MRRRVNGRCDLDPSEFDWFTATMFSESSSQSEFISCSRNLRPVPEHVSTGGSAWLAAVGLENTANRKSLTLRMGLLMCGVALATWLIPSVGTAATAKNVADVVGTPITPPSVRPLDVRDRQERCQPGPAGDRPG